MEVRPLNVAVWGLGRHALKNILPAIKVSAHTKLVGVYTRNQDAARLACQQHDCFTWPKEEAMLNDPRVDAVYLSTPIGLHHSQGVLILNSNKHLICEKSLTHSRETSLNLIDRARHKGLVLCETFMYLYHPKFLHVLELVRNPNFGEMHSLTCNLFLPKLENPGYRYNPDLGGGAFLDAGCYPVSLALAITRDGEIPSVRYSSIKTKNGFTIDTSGLALLEWNNGAHACLSWGYGVAYRNDLSILGGKQSIYSDYAFSKGEAQKSNILVYDEFGKPQNVEIEPANSFVEMFSYIHQATLNHRMRDALLSQAARQSELLCLIRKHARHDDR